MTETVRRRSDKKFTPIVQKTIIASRKGVDYELTTMNGTIVDSCMILAGLINRDLNSLMPMMQLKGWRFREGD